MNYIIITVEERDKWKSYIKRARFSDFYHSWHYHAKLENGEPFLFVYEKEEIFIAIPLIKRKIADSGYSDLTSAYGYIGPVTNSQNLSDEFLSAFKAAFLSFLDQEKIVCVFSRLHPLMDQVRILENIGGLYANGHTVYMDLDRTIEEQTRHYRKSVKNSINALICNAPVVSAVVTDAELSTFVSIYSENMKRIGADEYYQFDQQYFQDLIGTDEFFSMPLLMYIDDVAIAAGFFVYTRDIVQVHLLATRTDYLHLSPTKFLIHEASKIGREHRMKYLHLGGGVGGREDSLFFWKSGFSDQQLSFMTWRYIHDQSVYDQLTAKLPHGEASSKDFFPAYRALEKK